MKTKFKFTHNNTTEINGGITMKANHENTQRRLRTSILLSICLFTVLSGCSNANGTETQVPTTPTAEASAPAQTNAPTAQPNTATAQPNTQTGSNTEGLPTGVSIKRVIKEVTLKDGYHKKIELLTDGGKRVTITDPNQTIVLQQIEYEGIITAVNGDQVTVQVEGGGEQTLTIPSNVVIEDEDKLGLNKGVEIDWTVNAEGQIESVELED